MQYHLPLTRSRPHASQLNQRLSRRLDTDENIMNIVFILLPLTILLASFFVLMFIKMARAGQYDDLETPAYRILINEEAQIPQKK